MSQLNNSRPQLFDLSPESNFGKFVTDVYNTVSSTTPNEYTQWKNQRTTTPTQSPDQWDSFQIENENASLFLFSLESCISLTCRLLLRKAMNEGCIGTKFHHKEINTDILADVDDTIKQYFPQLAFNDVYSWWNDDCIVEWKESLSVFANTVMNNDDVDIDILGNVYQQIFDEKTQKKLGSFYTPSNVVSYINDEVKESITAESKIIDPSCGSGRFIIPLLQNENVNSDTCVIGIDVDPFAVLISRTRYAIHLVQSRNNIKDNTIIPIYKTDTLVDLFDDGDGQRKLNDLEDVPMKSVYIDEVNIDLSDIQIQVPKNNSVISGETMYSIFLDFMQQPIEVISDWSYNDTVLLCHKVDSEKYDTFHESFMSICKAIQQVDGVENKHTIRNEIVNVILGGISKQYILYDVIVGNPPYVNIKTVSDKKSKMYKKKYKSASGRYDLYVLFIEWALERLNENGELGLITSNKFMRTQYGQSVRECIAEDYTIEKIIDFSGVDVFTGVTTMASILIVKNKPPNDNEVPYVKVTDSKSVKDYNNVLENSNQHGIESSFFPQSSLEGDFWKLLSPKIRTITNKIKTNSMTTLGDVCTGIRQGVSSGCDDVFVINKQTMEEWSLEEELIFPLINGRDVRRWEVDWGGDYAIYPYNKNGMVNIENYPNILNYLDNHKNKLEDRYCVRERNATIYQYDGPRSSSVFEGDWKIVTPDISSENNFCSTNGYELFKNTVYVITFNEPVDYSYEMMIGILNNPIIEFFIDQQSPKLRGIQRRYKSHYLSSIPLPKPDSDLEELVCEVLNGNSNEKNVNDHVRKLYSLSKEEYQTVCDIVGRNE